MPKHIGIVGVTSEGAALCYRTICQEGEAQHGYAHPEVTLHNLSLADYMRSIEAEDWPAVGRLLLESATKLARIGAAFAICPDNTAHQGLNVGPPTIPHPLAPHRRRNRRASRATRLQQSRRARHALVNGRSGLCRSPRRPRNRLRIPRTRSPPTHQLTHHGRTSIRPLRPRHAPVFPASNSSLRKQRLPGSSTRLYRNPAADPARRLRAAHSRFHPHPRPCGIARSKHVISSDFHPKSPRLSRTINDLPNGDPLAHQIC